MSTQTSLRIPVTVNVKSRAEAKAEQQGFSSLQEVIRAFLTNYIDGSISLPFGKDTLSTKAKDRYEKDLQETKEALKTKKIPVFNTEKDALKHLETV